MSEKGSFDRSAAPIARRSGFPARRPGGAAPHPLFETSVIDSRLAFKLRLLAEHDDARAILDALLVANLSRLADIREGVCALLRTTRAKRPEAAE